MTRNRLGDETSPYLLQHQDNPVHWYAWGPEALAAAKAADKPILLSVGYAACHWCHVMAHESFEDDGIAGLMNERFINVKVDREERPDIDTIYQTALALLGQHGGWPLTMFLTPDGEPFWGGTYFPPDSRYGRPGFPDVLQRIHEVYTTERDSVTKNKHAIAEALTNLAIPQPGQPVFSVGPTLLDQAAAQLVEQIDRQYGGISGAPKFPHVPVFELLLRAYLRGGQAAYLDAVALTADRMSQGGIYDHLGGGFARYSTDQYWLVPHFEKMLYDNAQLIDLLCLLWQIDRNPLYRQRVEETVEWVLREMISDGGGFAATLDADSEGEEGKFYVWTATEIAELLGAGAAAFGAAYDVTPTGNWEGNTILNRSAGPGLGDAEAEAALAAQREVLFDARAQRIWPGWDDKVLADWNGQMIAAMANASAVFARPDWLASAETAFAFVRDRMTVDGRLRHSCRNGKARHAALLDDYALMADAALTLHEITGTRAYRDQAEAWLAIVETHYKDDKHGGYFYTADDAEALIARTRTAMDNAVPAGNGVLVRVFARLYHLTGNDAYRARAEDLVLAFNGDIGRSAFGHATLLNGYEMLQGAVQVVITGDRESDETRTLLEALYGVAQPDKVVQIIGADDELPATHPAHGKSALEGRATAYVCVGTTCSLPVTDAAGLLAALPAGPSRHA
jgi:uncharacterized protein YyaL (SSP411 family)